MEKICQTRPVRVNFGTKGHVGVGRVSWKETHNKEEREREDL